MAKRKFIDFSRLREIPIVPVAEMLGLEVVKQGSGVWAVKEGNDVTSLRLFESSNRWKRFSGKESNGLSEGSVIDLVISVRGDDLPTAAKFLSSHFL